MSATVNKDLISKLPNKPSAMIRLALHDVAAVLKAKKAKINMNYWMVQDLPKKPGGKAGRCEVCFGGAVMMQTLKIDPLVHGHAGTRGFALKHTEAMDVRPCDLMPNRKAVRKIEALDYFRKGMVARGLRVMSAPARKIDAIVADELITMPVPQFNRTADWPAFRRAMQKMARALERRGL